MVFLFINMAIFYFLTIESNMDFFRYSVFHNLILDELFIIIGWMVAPIIGLWVGNYIGLFLLRIHKKIIGRKKEYYIIRKSSQLEFKYKFTDLLVSALIALNFASIISNNSFFQELILSDLGLAQHESAHTMYILPLILVFTIFISVALYTPSILLFRTGIVYIDKIEGQNGLELIEIKRIGSFYLTFLKGYAGIAVIFNLLTLAIETFFSFSDESGITPIIFLITFSVFPFIISFIMIPLTILIEKSSDKRIQNYLRYGNKMGISTPLDDIIIFK